MKLALRELPVPLDSASPGMRIGGGASAGASDGADAGPVAGAGAAGLGAGESAEAGRLHDATFIALASPTSKRQRPRNGFVGVGVVLKLIAVELACNLASSSHAFAAVLAAPHVASHLPEAALAPERKRW